MCGYVTHNYTLDGTKILSETVKYSSIAGDYTLYYVYDANGSITGLHYNGAPYYFQKNIQGDILRICNAGGAVVVEYIYDAWGNILSVTGSLASSLGQYNPFRYRGYYYDSETGLYYLNSRYYDAEVGRFISADGIIGANGGLQGYNMFAYCNNNPVMSVDITGYNAEALDAANGWAATMWWLCGADVALPIGDLIYAVGVVTLYTVAIIASWEVMTQPIEIADESTLIIEAEHIKGARNSTKNKHEKGQSRKQRDKRGEKGDARRKDYSNKRRNRSYTIPTLFEREASFYDDYNLCYD